MKVKTNFWIDILMLIFFIIVSITGLILFTNLGFDGIRNYDLKLIHDYAGIILIIIMAIHFLLHFNWIVSVGRTILKK
jgi:cytochrome b subunit of formate dehydrogenase